MTTPSMKAELRNWVQTSDERDTFQGYIYNDVSHSKDGTFITIHADNVERNNDGILIYDGANVYWAWNVHRRRTGDKLLDNLHSKQEPKATKDEFKSGLKKDLFDED